MGLQATCVLACVLTKWFGVCDYVNVDHTLFHQECNIRHTDVGVTDCLHGLPGSAGNQLHTCPCV
jgi:hypothetical protein